MANARFAWGIDIGNRALKAIKLVREGETLRVDDFEVIEHETVLSNSGDNREALITASLNNFVQRHQIKGGAVAIGVSGQASFARFIKLPPVEPKKIPEIVRFEAIQQIPFPLDDVEWSYQLFQGGDSPDVEVGIFAMRKELINQHIKNFTDQNLNVQAVQMNPLAVYNAMYYDQRIEGTTMIIDLGAENTDLIIADAETVWMRSIPIGGNNFTETLVKSFKLNFTKAEDLKRNAATSKYARQIFQAMRPVFADLVAEVQRSIGFYASVHRDSRIKKIIAVGGTFKLPGLQKYLQQNLQLEVERLDTLGAGAPNDPKQGAAFQDNILSLVSSYGLALQAMGEGKITSSLLPQRIKRERLWQEKTKFFGAAAALFVLGTGIGYGSYFVHNMSYEAKSSERSQIEQIQRTAADLDRRWTEIQGAGATDRQRILNVRGLTNYRNLWPTILADLRKSVPPLPADPAQLKQTPRDQRKQIDIETMTSVYRASLADVMAAPTLATFANTQGQQIPTGNGGQMMPMGGFGGGGAGFGGTGPGALAPDAIDAGAAAAGANPAGGAAGTAGAAGGESGRGIILTIAGTTPYSQPAALLNQSVIASLHAIGKNTYPDGHPYYVAKAEVVHLAPLAGDSAKLQKIDADYQAALQAKQSGTTITTPGFTMPTGTGGPEADAVDRPAGVGFGAVNPAPDANAAANAAAAAAAKAFEDRRMPGEDIRKDYEFIIVAALVLDPGPKDAAAAAAATQPTTAESGAATPAGEAGATAATKPADATTPAP